MNSPSKEPSFRRVAVTFALAAAVAVAWGTYRCKLLGTSGLGPEQKEEPTALVAKPDEEPAEGSEGPLPPEPLEPPPWPDVLNTDGCHVENPEVQAWLEQLQAFPDTEAAALTRIDDACRMARAIEDSLNQEKVESINYVVENLSADLASHGFDVYMVENPGFTATFEFYYPNTPKTLTQEFGDEAAEAIWSFGIGRTRVTIYGPEYDDNGTPIFKGGITAPGAPQILFFGDTPEHLRNILFEVIMNG